jgi:hypothetical protein
MRHCWWEGIYVWIYTVLCLAIADDGIKPTYVRRRKRATTWYNKRLLLTRLKAWAYDLKRLLDALNAQFCERVEQIQTRKEVKG